MARNAGMATPIPTAPAVLRPLCGVVVPQHGLHVLLGQIQSLSQSLSVLQESPRQWPSQVQAGCEVVESAALKIVGNPEKAVILAVFDITQIRRGRGYVVIRYVIYLKVVSEDRTHTFKMDHT